MKAVGYQKSVSGDIALTDLDIPCPIARGHDLLVEIKAVSVNPVDTKVRKASPADGEIKVLGWDAAGVVKAVGEHVTLFSPGDKVWYAGALQRPGTHAQFHLVDERIVGRMPATLTFAEAAAMPLTVITAWEILFDRLEVQRAPQAASLLVIGASGGVGSVLVQLAQQRTHLKVLATASRLETVDWLQGFGVDDIVNHRRSIAEQLCAAGYPAVEYIVSLNHTEQHFAAMVELIAPQGKIALIDDPESIDIRQLKRKSVSLHWEYMFTRAMFGTRDLIMQHQILNQVAEMVDAGQIRTTLRQHLGTINAEHVGHAHRLIEQGTTIGKIVLEGF